MEDIEPYSAENKIKLATGNEPRPPQPMHDALNQLNVIFTEILKCAIEASTINLNCFIRYNQQLENIEEKIKDLKIYLERKIR